MSKSNMLDGMKTQSPKAPSGYEISGMATKLGAGDIGRKDPAPKVKSIGGRVA